MYEAQDALWFITADMVVGPVPFADARPPPRNPTPEHTRPIWRIQIDECEKAGITLDQMLGVQTFAYVAQPRMRAMARCVDELSSLGYSLPRIGKAFNRHHTTVIHAHRKFGVKRNG